MTLCTGCWQPPAVIARQVERGLVWMVPGIEGHPCRLSWACRGLRDAGVDAKIHVYDWSRPLLDPLKNLEDYEGNLQRAGEIAEQLATYRRAHPQASVDLVGYSGGGGLAVMVVEALPEDVRLRNVILVQPALSPGYDLTAALSRIDGKLVNFFSPYDWLILGLGTRVFGTMDRREVASAGKERFDLARAVREPTLRAKVEQRGWELRMIGDGHIGTHLSMLSYWWNRRYVAPYLLGG